MNSIKALFTLTLLLSNIAYSQVIKVAGDDLAERQLYKKECLQVKKYSVKRKMNDGIRKGLHGCDIS